MGLKKEDSSSLLYAGRLALVGKAEEGTGSTFT